MIFLPGFWNKKFQVSLFLLNSIKAINLARSLPKKDSFCRDESHFSNEPYVQRGWFLVGEKKKVPTPKNREKRTIIGALNLETKKVYWKQAKRETSKVFIEFLYQLRQSFPDKLIILILDNSSIHKSKRVKKFLESNAWVKLQPLTPYSPKYNPIERFWRWLKRKVYGSKSLRTIEQVIARVRKFIWHYHEKRLVEAINFNFKPYAEMV
jgi:transposase